MDYEKMLNLGKKELPDSVLNVDRFNIPKVRGHIQGNKTVISNFFQISDALGRDNDFFLKFILKELGTPGEINKNLVILGRKISANNINQKISVFASKYVICKICGKPETKLTKKNRLKYINCNACGARYPIT